MIQIAGLVFLKTNLDWSPVWLRKQPWRLTCLVATGVEGKLSWHPEGMMDVVGAEHESASVAGVHIIQHGVSKFGDLGRRERLARYCSRDMRGFRELQRYIARIFAGTFHLQVRA